MRWKSIKLIILILLAVLNAVLGLVRLGVVRHEKKERDEALASALKLCEVRGIKVTETDYSALDRSYPYYLLGSSVLEEYPVISTEEKQVFLSLSQAITAAGRNLKKQYPTLDFALQETEPIEAGWTLTYCRREEAVLHLEDRAYARVGLSGSLTIRYEYWEVTERAEQSVSYDSGTLLAQALLRLEKQGVTARSLDGVHIAYRTEKEDRIAYSVPYAVFEFTLENGSAYEVYIKTGER